MKTKPAHEGRVAAHQDQQRKILQYAVQRTQKILPCKVKINKTADGKRDEVHDQRIIVVIEINEFDIQQDQDDIKRGYKAHGGLLIRGDPAQWHKCAVQVSI